MVAGVQGREFLLIDDTLGTLPYPPTLYVSGEDEVLRGRTVVIVLPRDADPVRAMLRRLGEDVDVVARFPAVAPPPDVYVLPSIVTGWLSPRHCGIHGARVQRRLNRAGSGRWRVRTVEVRRRQPGGRETRREPLPVLTKQVRKAMRRLARETGR